LNLGYFADHRGRIVTEMSVMRHDDDLFTLMTAAVAQWHDLEWLQKHLPEDGSLSLTDHTLDYAVLLVTGPKARDILAPLSDGDLSLPWLTHQKATVNGITVLLARVSFAGELGWEIHGATADMPALYEAVLGAGATPFGMYALNSLRLEKGYRTWKGDLSTDYTMFEGGLDRFIKLDKEQDYPGKQALMSEKQQGAKKRFVTMLVDLDEFDAPYMSTVWNGDEVVGEITSGGYGYRVDKAIALGVVRSDLANVGNTLEIEVYGKRHKAAVQADEPLWDAGNERIRG